MTLEPGRHSRRPGMLARDGAAADLLGTRDFDKARANCPESG